jgi:hypothetical protein
MDDKDGNIHLIMASGSIRNTTFGCDSLGIQYEISHSDCVVKVERWNSFTDQLDYVAEFKLPAWKPDIIRFSPDDDFKPLKEFLTKGEGSTYM